MRNKQQEQSAIQDRNIASMDEQCDHLRAEKQLTIDEINVNKEELERLKEVLQQKKDRIGEIEEGMASIDHKID